MASQTPDARAVTAETLEEAIRLTSGPGNGTMTRTRPIEEWRRLDRLFRAALSAPHPDPEPREALRHLPPATCYRTHTQPDEGKGVFGAVWLADVDRALRVEPSSIDVERLTVLDCEGREIGWTAFSAVDWLDHGDRAAADHQLADLCDRDLAALLRPLADAYAARLTQEATRAERTRE